MLISIVGWSTHADDLGTKTQWYSDSRVGFRAGAKFSESAMGRNYDPGGTVGGELALGIPPFGDHRAIVSAGYLFLGNEKEGTDELVVKTENHRFDFTAGYEFRWKALLVGARLGLALTIVSNKTLLFNRGNPAIDFADSSYYYYYPNRVLIDSYEQTGTEPGFLADAAVGLNTAHFFKQNDLWQKLRLLLVVRGDYLRRGERDDFVIFASVVFCPEFIFRPKI